MEVDVEIVETAGVEAGRTTDDAMDVVALFEEKLSSAGECQSAVNPVTRYANAYGALFAEHSGPLCTPLASMVRVELGRDAFSGRPLAYSGGNAQNGRGRKILK